MRCASPGATAPLTSERWPQASPHGWPDAGYRPAPQAAYDDTVGRLLSWRWTGQAIPFILPLLTFFRGEPAMFGPSQYVLDTNDGIFYVKHHGDTKLGL